MTTKEITGDQFEEMIQELENGTFVPTANEGAPQPLYTPYDGWYEFLEADQCAYDAITDQYLEYKMNH